MTEARIRTYAEFGMKSITSKEKGHVAMTPKDVQAIRSASNANSEFASMILLGFKPQDSVPFTHTIDRPYFVYPNDEVAQGSIVAFAHLHASMLRKRVLAIGELLTRKTATSRLVALWPLEAEEGFRCAPGMLAVLLPFEDDMKVQTPEPPIDDELVTAELVEAAGNLVQHQTLVDAVIGQDFENAALLKYWNTVQQFAIPGTPACVESEFDTVVNEKEISELCGKEIDHFKSLLPDDIAVKKEAGQKRKKVLPADESGINWESVYWDQAWSDCKVPQLKAYLGSVGLPKTGNKNDLIGRAQKHMESQLLVKQEQNDDKRTKTEVDSDVPMKTESLI